MPARRTIMAQQILRNGRLLVEETIEAENGCHTLFQHVGLTDNQLSARSRRTGKKEVSTFFSRETLLECVKDFLSDPRGVDEIVNWVLDGSAADRYDKCTGAIFLEDGDCKCLGRVCYQDGEIVDGYGYRLILGRREYGYTNHHTGLPFDIITVYVEE